MKKFLTIIISLIICFMMFSGCNPTPSGRTNPYVEEVSGNQVLTHGRAYKNEDGNIVLENVNSSIDFWFTGTECKVKMRSVQSAGGVYSYITVFVDDNVEGERLEVPYSKASKVVAQGLENKKHKISIVKDTEQYLYSCGSSKVIIYEIVENENCTVEFPDLTEKSLIIDVYGDSISCGAGNLGSQQSTNLFNSNGQGSMSYLAITGRTLNAEISICSLSGACVYGHRNASSFTEIPLTNTYLENCWNKYSCLTFKDYDIDTNADFVIISCGTNDSALLNTNVEGSFYSEAKLNAKYLQFLKALRSRYKKATIIWACWENSYSTSVKNAVNMVTDTEFGGYIYSFRTSGNGALGHPTVEDHKAVAENFTQFLNQIISNK